MHDRSIGLLYGFSEIASNNLLHEFLNDSNDLILKSIVLKSINLKLENHVSILFRQFPCGESVVLGSSFRFNARGAKMACIDVMGFDPIGSAPLKAMPLSNRQSRYEAA